MPLRFSEPYEIVVADLENYIPRRLREADVPGLAIALIHNKRVVWSAGFGLANKITGRAVTPETVFEAASISKVVTTYIALRLVEKGKLTVDDPLSARLSNPWLPHSGYAGKITLRHVVSHSSGLTDNVFPTIDKSIAFAPGSAFLYTGIGFMYMQEAIEQVTTGVTIRLLLRKKKGTDQDVGALKWRFPIIEKGVKNQGLYWMRKAGGRLVGGR